jgi:hypothetical protein
MSDVWSHSDDIACIVNILLIRNAVYQVRSQIDVTVGGNHPEDSFRCAFSAYKVRTIACES